MNRGCGARLVVACLSLGCVGLSALVACSGNGSAGPYAGPGDAEARARVGAGPETAAVGGSTEGAVSATASGSGGAAAAAGSASPAATGASAPAADCPFGEVVPTLVYGEFEEDFFGHMVFDEATGELLLSTLTDVFVLPPGAVALEHLMARPRGSRASNDRFWVVGDQLLFPINDVFRESPDPTRLPVAHATDRDGGNLRAVVSEPAPAGNARVNVVTKNVVMDGDELLWIEYETGSSLGSTYRARRADWRTPTEPTTWYESEHELDHLVAAGGMGYVVDDPTAPTLESRRSIMVHLADNRVEPVTALERFGGAVVAADEQSLIVSNDSSDEPERNGTFRVAPDGSGRQLLAQLEGTSMMLVHRGGRWAFMATDAASRFDIFVYEPGSEPRRVGCIDGATPQALELADDEVYVSVFRGESIGATLTRFAL